MAAYLIENDNAEHGRRICERISRPFIPGLDRCLSRSRDGELLGGVVYQDHFPPTSVCIHVASWHPRWLSRDFLWAIFDFPFNVMGVQNVIGLVSETQPDVLEFDLSIGFEEKNRLPGIVPGGDLIVLYMERGKCRWLVDSRGRPYTPRTLRAEFSNEQRPVAAPAA